MENFDDIRSYRDEEAKEVCQRLLSNEEVISLIRQLLPDLTDQDLEKSIQSVNGLWDFQNNLMLPIFKRNILSTFDELSVSGLDKLDKNKAYLFISNHRDIVLDSAVLNFFLHEAGHDTAEIAIGDNLLKERWIEDLVRLNKSFIVKRGLDKMEMLRASKKLSEYIKDAICRRNSSVWIAQRAGRAKDGNDETNRGLLTMFGMSNDGDILEHFSNLNIVPVSVSYEFDPCDGRKTREIYVEQHHGEYVKSESEDVESMKMGIILPKGKGHIHFGETLNKEIKKLDADVKKSELTQAIGELIDERIQSNYKIWPTNHIAYSMMHSAASSDFTEREKEIFTKRLKSVVEMLDGSEDELKEIFLNMYCQPLSNKLARRSRSSIS